MAWREVTASDYVINYKLYETTAVPVPATVIVAYSTGFGGDYLPDSIKQLIFIEAALRREFPLGVGDRGEVIAARPPASELIRAEWAPVYDLHGILP